MVSEYQATCCLKHYVYNYNSPKCGGISPQVTLHVTPHLNKDLGGGVKVYVFNVVQRPHKATQEEMSKFHSDDYVKFLRCIRPDNMSEYNKLMQRCKYLHGRTWPSPF